MGLAHTEAHDLGLSVICKNSSLLRQYMMGVPVGAEVHSAVVVVCLFACLVKLEKENVY